MNTFIKTQGGLALSSIENRVLNLLAEGMQNKEIADILCLSVHTIKNHKTNMCVKLSLPNIQALYKYAFSYTYVIKMGGGEI